MAFQSWCKKPKGGNCSDEYPCYQHCKSRRAIAVIERNGASSFWRVCAHCELDPRMDERACWPEETRRYRGTECITDDRVFRDF